jgi:hypothetical protein
VNVHHDRDSNDHHETPGPPDPASTAVTNEVGSEGGAPGDVELEIDHGRGVGSEAGEMWQPTGRREREVVRDETGEGRRSP